MPANSVVVTAVSLNPFSAVSDMLAYDFMRYAFVAGTAISILSGLVGYFVVLRRLAFAGDALSHTAFAAALGGLLLGLDPLAGMFIITIGVAAGMGIIAPTQRSHDVAVGTVFAWILGVGALLLSVYTSRAGSNGQIGVNVLFGSVFGIQLEQARASVIVGAVAVVLLLAIARPLLFSTLDPAVALARGVPVRTLGLLFLVILAITVAESVQAVGALLVLALLVLPAAIAQRLTYRPYVGLALSMVLAVAITWTGLIIGYYTPYPVGFVITSLAFTSYLLLMMGGNLAGRRKGAGHGRRVGAGLQVRSE